MTATDELRRLLDERGVEWWQSANTLGCIFTRRYSPIFGDEVVAMENGKEGLVLFDHFVTPEQAIEATLGRGTCHNAMPLLPSGMPYPDSWMCSECGGRMDGIILEIGDYCPNCGRKIVVE